ncbi:S9 family peptidase [bacterium]|nr:S9 family peptidase [bacterium]
MKKFYGGIAVGVVLAGQALLSAQEPDDPFLYMEEVHGARAMEWVVSHNEKTAAELSSVPGFEALKSDILRIYDAKERIAYPSFHGDYLYNYWQDADNPRGLWRRTTLDSYLSPEPQWETVLDIDALCKEENENWVYKGASYLYPGDRLCLVMLSRGGSDAVVMREFNLQTRQFVKDGFSVPEAKGQAGWIDEHTLLIGTDFGGGTLTESGYARQAKIWKRGTALADAPLYFEGKTDDMGVWGMIIDTPEGQYRGVQRALSFYEFEVYMEQSGHLVKLDMPLDCSFGGIFKGQLLLQPKTDWTTDGGTWHQGELISIDYERFLAGDRKFSVIASPGERSSIAGYASTKDMLLLNMLTDVKSELFTCRFSAGGWTKAPVPAPELGNIGIAAADEFSNRYFFTYQNFLNPSTLYFVSEDGAIQEVRSLPDFFDASPFEVRQYQTASSDGTMIPYFIVFRRDMQYTGDNPVLIYAYGGFEISMQPGYNATIGAAWLEQGGVYVLANIRGGGEFGPKWHQAGLKQNRQLVYDDFYAVAEDLIGKKITGPSRLGIMGGSNGGLLVGVAFTQRPDLYHAVVCQVPLLDMKRYNKLLAGASWMAEYGNPDIPEEWAYIKTYSPYQNLKPSISYPKVFFTTTTRDDRVHPAHARKMAALMEKQGHPFYYYENTEGGHGSGVTNEQRAFMSALQYAYLKKMLIDRQ